MLGSNPGYATWFLFFYFEGFVSLFRLLLGGGGANHYLAGVPRGGDYVHPASAPVEGQTECLGAARGAYM